MGGAQKNVPLDLLVMETPHCPTWGKWRHQLLNYIFPQRTQILTKCPSKTESLRGLQTVSGL